MRFSEYEYVGYKNTVSVPTKIYKIDEVPFDDKTENFKTIYRFTESIKKHSSVRDIGTDEYFYSDYLYFDIDFPVLNEATETALKLTSFLSEYDIGYESWFSGNKGYHICVPTIQFNFEPTNDERILKRMAQEIAASAGIKIDDKIYNVSRVIRMPYSLHRIGNNKIPWPKEDAEYPDPEDYLVNDTLIQVYQKVIAELKAKPSDIKTGSSAIVRMFSEAFEGDRNMGCYKRAKFLRERHIHVDDALYMLKNWNGLKCNPPLPEKEIERTVESAYRGDVFYIDEGKVKTNRVQLSDKAIASVIKSYKDFGKNVVKTGIKFFDQYTMGLFPGDMIFWLAVNGNFKTAILSSLSQRISALSDKYSIIFSADMPSSKLLPRHVAYAEQCSIKQAIGKLKRGQKSQAFLDQFKKVITIDCPSLTVESLYKDVEYIKDEIGDVGFIGIDYLGAMQGCDNDTKKTADTIHEVHSMVKTIGSCPCMMLVQARREYEGRGGDIEVDKVGGKDASAIEHKADFMMASWWHGHINHPERWGRFLKARQFDSELFMQNAYFMLELIPEQMRLVNATYRADHPDFNQKKKIYQN